MQESQVDKNGLTVFKGFVLLPGTNSNHIQQLNLLLPTVHIYIVNNCIWRLFAGNCVPFCYTKAVCDLIATLGCCASRGTDDVQMEIRESGDCLREIRHFQMGKF